MTSGNVAVNEVYLTDSKYSFVHSIFFLISAASLLFIWTFMTIFWAIYSLSYTAETGIEIDDKRKNGILVCTLSKKQIPSLFMVALRAYLSLFSERYIRAWYKSMISPRYGYDIFVAEGEWIRRRWTTVLRSSSHPSPSFLGLSERGPLTTNFAPGPSFPLVLTSA